MEQKTGGKIGVAVVAALVVGGIAGYWYGGKIGYDMGYAKAEEDASQVEEEAAKKATEETSKAANPFKAKNPLENVETDAFKEVKKILNPFE
ncbi:MAG: hypothetical protein Q8R20_00330 [Nanoarchaeota archaeon]|nr:hypothetical protein [Nanoarchaeota archaeon]